MSSIGSPDARAFPVAERGVVWDPDADQSAVSLRFGRDASVLSVTCAINTCKVGDIVAGRTRLSQSLTPGRAVTVSMTANTAIDAKE